MEDSRIDLGREIRIASNSCALLFMTSQINFSRANSVTELSFEINRIESYIILGKAHL